MDKLREKKFNLSCLTNYRSIFMGLAIISIIIFHYTDDCRIYHYNFTGWIKYYNMFISSSGVDIFLLLSGFGLYYSFKKNNNVKEFYKKRFVKILIPYLVFCLPAIIWKHMILGNDGILSVIKQFSYFSFFKSGETWFWYIFMICVCYFIFPYLFHYIDEDHSDSRLLSIINFTLIMNIILYVFYNKLYANINIMTLRFFPFIFGIYIGKWSYQKKEISFYNCFVIIILSILMILLRLSMKSLLVRIGVFSLAFGVCFLLTILFERINKTKLYKVINKVFSKIGEYTLELYLTHVCVRTILCSYDYLTCRVRYYLLVVAFSILLSILLKNICSFLSKRFLKA